MSIAEMALALLLARTCVAEIGLHEESTVEECQLMWTVNKRNAEMKGRTILAQTLKFNSFWKVKERRALRPFIEHLNGPEKPQGWPNALKWSRYQGKWMRYRNAAILFVKRPQDFSLMCSEAVDYGGPGEVPKAKYLEPVQCLGGVTRQKYWRIKPTSKAFKLWYALLDEVKTETKE
jgi:hypothetical protein